MSEPVVSAAIIAMMGYEVCARCKKRSQQVGPCEFCGHVNDHTFANYNQQEPIMIPEGNPVDEFDISEEVLHNPRDLSDEEEVAYDDGKDIADTRAGRPESGIVPDNPDAA